MSRNRVRFAGTVMCCIACAFAPTPSAALDIVLRPATAGTENPFYDPDASGLLSILTHVAGVYENAIPENYTMTVTYGWDIDLNDEYIGLHNCTTSAATGLCTMTPGGFERSAFVSFPPDIQTLYGRPWYIDPTPSDDSEFAMAQTLYNYGANALTNGQRVARFSGAVPNTFEAGYSGAALNNAPQNARQGFDLLSIAFQEVGHALGLSTAYQGTLVQVADPNASLPLGVVSQNDFDYDVNPAFVAGANMAILPRDQSTGIAHLAGDDTVMSSIGSSGIRYRPSATDLMAMAAGSGFSEINLVRVDFLGPNSQWTTAANWMGNRIPDLGDDVYIRHNNPSAVTINTAGITQVGSINVANNTTLTVGGGGGLTTLSASRIDVRRDAGAHAAITVTNNGRLSGNTFNVGDGGAITLVDGEVTGGALTIESGGQIFGHGLVAANGVVNHGSIVAAFNETLTINASNPASQIDLDGSQASSSVEAVLGNVVVEDPLTDGFGGTLTVGVGRSATFNAGFTAEFPAHVNLNGNSTTAATLAGSGVSFVGPSVLTINGLGIITPATSFNGADVHIPSASSRLRLTGFTTYVSGHVDGAGTLEQNGSAQVTGTVYVDVATFDLDGTAGNNSVIIQSGAELNIQSQNLDASANDGYDGSMTLNSGTLIVSPNWRIDNTLNLNNTGGGTPTLTGPGTLTLHTTSVTRVNGNATIASPLVVSGGVNILTGELDLDGSTVFNSTAVVDIDANARLDLNGDATFRGGSYVGNGRIKLDGQMTIAANTTIGTAELDWDGDTGNSTTLVQPGVTFSIASSTTETSTNDGHDGVVNVNSGTLSVLAGWRLDGVLIMTNSQAGTPTLNGVGALRVHGGAQMNTIGDSVVNAPLVVAGTLRVHSGLTRVTGPFTVEAPALLSVAGSMDVTPAWNIPVGAELFLENGRVAGGSINNDGHTTGAGAIAAMQFTNNLLVRPGLAAATAGVLRFINYRQSTDGRLQIEIGGGRQGQEYDFVDVRLSADLAGALDASLIDGFAPLPGDVFTIMEYGSRLGTFDKVYFPDGAAGLIWSINYLADRITLTTDGLPGDINLDGHVNVLDVALFTPFLGQASTGWTSGDFNGDALTTMADLSIIQTHLGQSLPGAPSPLATAVSEPANASSLLAAILVCGVTLAARRRIRTRHQGESTIYGKNTFSAAARSVANKP